jgi:(p)ppGpp synthase/HD superfamily hydrolase
MYSDRVFEAIEFVYEKHKNQYRKKSKIPYIVHLFDVMYILYYERELDSSIDEDLIIGGLLHDVNEDCNVSFDEIEQKFGKKVREYVFHASEPEELRKKCNCKSDTWKARKIHTIENIKNLSKKSKYLLCADKLSNLNSIYNDVICLGDSNEEIWNKFHASKEEIKWYYSSCIKELSEIKESCMHKKIKLIYSKIFKEDL